ncbi:hypothetical protein NUW58_g768 [Xylaria curta]|uniref:Uncharacterized protein n=1 Tax=Xylaria curta TaxID=42375 RepID=A0ACC1PN05_9PEZI|nr:hypothetical protein NUW58_g768 [Xylaria curta]
MKTFMANPTKHKNDVSATFNQNARSIRYFDDPDQNIERVHISRRAPTARALHCPGTLSRRKAGSRTSHYYRRLGMNHSHWDAVFGKLDGLSEGMANVKTTLEGLQRDSHERVVLQNNLKETQDSLNLTNERLREVEKAWKKAATHLNRMRSKEVGKCQLDDSSLVSLVMQLRFSIRNFSMQYFAGKLPLQQSRYAQVTGFKQYMLATIYTESRNYQTDLVSDTNRPTVMQSFLWRLLVGEIFEHFHWAPRLRESMTRVSKALQPAYENDTQQEASITPNAHSEFQSWKASTSNLIVKSMEDEHRAKEDYHEVGAFARRFSAQILESVRSFTNNLDDGILDLQLIIEDAISLDREICSQAAPVEWVFAPPRSRTPFNSNTMELEIGEAESHPGEYVSVVTAPALTKRGRYTEKPSLEDRLLKMTVVCR